MSINIKPINQLSDNYSYVIYDKENQQALIVDPSDEKPILEFINNNSLSLIAILITHHHSDHTSGIMGIKKKYNISIYSPNNNIEGTTNIIKDSDQINLGFINFDVISTPGHTIDHVSYYCEKEKLLFSGDTLFYYGCGRVFEGTIEQMLTSLKKIIKLPDETNVYCGHEYTYKNLEFLLDELVISPNKGAIKAKCRNLIKKNGSSMPFNLGHQKSWNPFLNCNSRSYKTGIASSYENIGKISAEASELDFFTYIREKRNKY